MGGVKVDFSLPDFEKGSYPALKGKGNVNNRSTWKDSVVSGIV